MQQHYMLTIRKLFSMSGSGVYGAEALIAIMDGEREVDRFTVSGKCQNPNGYRRSYTGKPGLHVQHISGPGRITFEPVN